MPAAYPFYQVDAFASRVFEGNQACVMPLEAFLPDETLQAIAAENNVAETAYIVPAGEGRWQLRWFTPAVEVPLCGHATLASAHVIFQHLGYKGERIECVTRQSGSLFITRATDGYVMDFPAYAPNQIDITEDLVTALGARPIAAYGDGLIACVFETPEEVRALTPDFKALAEVGMGAEGWERGNVGCLALGGANGADVTSRFFAPGSGIDEDPATGGWHCLLAPVVSLRTGRTELTCCQAYEGRGAWIGTNVSGDRVKLTGQAVTVIEGTFRL